MNIAIINYGMGNLASIANMLKKVGVHAHISSDVSIIAKANKLILPGVGAFDHAMENLSKGGFVAILNNRVINEKIPILGICLGMQLLTKRSEEGSSLGLGWIDAETVRFKFDDVNSNLKIPHMGWNQLFVRQAHPLFADLEVVNRFYFEHSYHVVCADSDNVLATTSYGFDFISAIVKDNIIGVQFHPEKSHKFGMQVLKNFLEKY